MGISVKSQAQITLIQFQTDQNNKWEVSLKSLLQANYSIDFEQMKAKEGFVPYSIEMTGYKKVNGYFSMKQSSIGLEVKNTANNKNFSAYLEMDFYGKNGTTAPRFKHGFVRWNGWTVGQTTSNFSDAEVYPNIFDFNGPSGLLYSRRIQISHYTSIGEKGTLSLSLEDPNTPSIVLPSDSLQWTKRAVIPSFSTMYRYGSQKNYIKAGFIILPISYGTKQRTDEYSKNRIITGWGAMFSGKIHRDESNIFSFESSFGKGIATYNSDLNGEKYDAIPNPVHDNLLETLQLFNIVGIYEHWWGPKWSSVAFASYSRIGDKDFIPSDMTKSFYHMSLNLIFQPFKKFRTGVEANYGIKQNFDKQKAHAWRIQTSVSLCL